MEEKPPLITNPLIFLLFIPKAVWTILIITAMLSVSFALWGWLGLLICISVLLSIPFVLTGVLILVIAAGISCICYYSDRDDYVHTIIVTDPYGTPLEVIV